MKNIILILMLSCCFWGCETQPPSAGNNDIIITGNDSTIAVKYNPQMPPAAKIILIEDFANVSCDPCVSANRIVESLVKNTFGYGAAAPIKYHTNFPGLSDPFYSQIPNEMKARYVFYNSPVFLPLIIVDGFIKPSTGDSLDIKEKITQRLQLTSRYKISAKDSMAGEDYFVKYTIDVRDTSGIDFNSLVCNVIITETEIKFNEPPGSNGETEFFDIMRVLFPTTNQGFKVITSHLAEVMNIKQVKINPSWNKEKLHAIVFIQDKNTKEVYQAVSTFK